MTTAPGRVANSQAAAVPANLALHQLPARFEAGTTLAATFSRKVVRFEHYSLSGVAIVIEARPTAVARPVATLVLVLVFAIGFAFALLYAGRPVEHALVRLSLPEPKPMSVVQQAGMRERVFVRDKTQSQPRLSALALAMPLAIESTTDTAPARPALSSTTPHALAIVDLVSVRAASDRAIATEIAQPWRGSGLHGYAVAGPVQFVGDSACRIVAVWVEANGTPGKSLSVRRCLDRSGKWDRTAVPNSPSASGAVGLDAETNG